MAFLSGLGWRPSVPVGTLPSGWVITRASPETVLVTAGIAYAVISVGMLLVPS